MGGMAEGELNRPPFQVGAGPDSSTYRRREAGGPPLSSPVSARGRHRLMERSFARKPLSRMQSHPGSSLGASGASHLTARQVKRVDVVNL